MALSLRILLGLTLYSAVSFAQTPEDRARAERSRQLSEAFRAAIGDTSPPRPSPASIPITERAIQMMEFLEQFPERDPNGPGYRERRLSDPNARRSANIEDRRTWEHFGELFNGTVTYYRDAAGNYFAVPRGGGTRQVRRDQIPDDAVGRKDGKVAPSSGNGVATLPEKTKGESSGSGGSKGDGWKPSDPRGNPSGSKGGGESQTKGSSSSDRNDSGKSGGALSGERSKGSSGSSSGGGSKSQSGSSSSSSKSTSSTKK